ncbi:MAG: hypothetical protein CMO80_06165 [Verrucomicrobiales bacterium]|nr:hypothetical protein [Verrucomicrobiales bacterium]
MPLQFDSLPARVTKSTLLRWILDSEEVKKQQVGRIEIFGRQGSVEVPDSAGPRLAKRLDGRKLNGRVTQVWYEGGDEERNRSGHFKKLSRWLEMERSAEEEQAAELREASGGSDSSSSLANLVMRRSQAVLAQARHALGNRLSELRDVVLGLKDPTCEDCPSLTFEDANLNESQQEAIACPFRPVIQELFVNVSGLILY